MLKDMYTVHFFISLKSVLAKIIKDMQVQQTNYSETESNLFVVLTLLVVTFHILIIRLVNMSTSF